MKKYLIFIFCILLVLTLTTPAIAANAIPKNVLQATESVVRIMAEYSDGYSYGTGFIIKSDDYSTLIVTNYHVVSDEPANICAWLSDTAIINAEILNYSTEKDICVLELTRPVEISALPFTKKKRPAGRICLCSRLSRCGRCFIGY